VRLVEGIADIDDLDAFLGRLNRVADAEDVTVQAFDARYIAGRSHLERAVELADRAIARGENVARERGVEILLYAAGRRQIDDALAMGVSEGRAPVVVVVSDAAGDGAAEAAAAAAVEELLDPAATLDGGDADRIRAFFDVTEAELDATDGDLAALVAERVALLDVEK
jgi:KEOPS complex subunit Cgi121